MHQNRTARLPLACHIYSTHVVRSSSLGMENGGTAPNSSRIHRRSSRAFITVALEQIMPKGLYFTNWAFVAASGAPLHRNHSRWTSLALGHAYDDLSSDCMSARQQYVGCRPLLAVGVFLFVCLHATPGHPYPAGCHVRHARLVWRCSLLHSSCGVHLARSLLQICHKVFAFSRFVVR